jgi:tripartite-type tricarboxylate transporter receptor subunit TctC
LGDNLQQFGNPKWLVEKGVSAQVLRESGFDGFPTAVWFVLMAPAGTPPAVITRLNEAVNLHILNEPIREGIRKIGMEPHVLAPEVLAKVIADETQLWQGVARETGVHLE